MRHGPLPWPGVGATGVWAGHALGVWVEDEVEVGVEVEDEVEDEVEVGVGTPRPCRLLPPKDASDVRSDIASSAFGHGLSLIRALPGARQFTRVNSTCRGRTPTFPPLTPALSSRATLRP